MEVEEAVRGAVLGVEAGQAAVQGRELPGVMISYTLKFNSCILGKLQKYF